MKEKEVLDEVLGPKALFVIACVILAISIVTFSLSMVYVQSVTTPTPAPDTGEQSGGGLPGGELIGMMLMMFASVVLMGIILLFHAFLWGAGMLVSARLAYSKAQKPRWMQIGAWILIAIFAIPTAIALCIVGYVVFTLFIL
ncbi:MAG: hypothetical protein E7594_00220 [Ruminococcaceae bacterium]|nr:hypothetical protein [Oscillospiraceae bacterium]